MKKIKEEMKKTCTESGKEILQEGLTTEKKEGKTSLDKLRRKNCPGKVGVGRFTARI